MADVTGSISDSSGIKDIHLNNAATEATLRLLLQSSLTGNNQLIGNIKTLAQKSGLDPNIVAAANNNLRQTTEETGALSRASHATTSVYQASSNTLRAHNQVISDSIDVMEKLTSGSGTASAVFSKFADLNTPIGLVFTGLTKLAAFQEAAMSSYQKMSASGVNFAGSLTDMRLAAAQSYMTLDNFTNLIKTNSKTFANMAGGAAEGAKSFSKLSNELIKSDAGSRLLSLGFTTDEVNQNLANYIELSGGLSAQDLKNTDKITKASAGYMEELDGLARITGESREQQQAQMKEAGANAAWQAKLATMGPEEKEKALAGMAQALALGGKGAMQAFQSKVMGVPPLTKEAQMFTATMGNANTSIMKSADAVSDSSKTMTDMHQTFADGSKGIQQDMSKFSIEQRAAIIAAGGPLASTFQVAGMSALKLSQMNETAILAALKKQEIEKTQAAAAAETQKALNEMGQNILAALMPATTALLPLVNGLVSGFGFVIKAMADLKEVTVGLIAALLVYKTKSMIDAYKSSRASGGPGGFRGALTAMTGFGGLGASADTAMYVRIVGSIPGGALGGVEDLLERQKKAKAAIKPGAPGSTRAARLAAVEAGRAAQATAAASTAAATAASTAAQGAKSILSKAGIIGTLAAGAMAIPTWMDINEKVKNKEMTEAEAKTEKGGLVGEVGGGVLGAAIGTAIFPVVGTILGGFLGSWLGKMAGEFSTAPKLAAGGIVNRPTMAMVGEGREAEAIIPLSKLSEMLKTTGSQNTQETIKTVTSELVKPNDKSSETLQTSIETLNKNITEMLRYARDTADHTKRTYEATRSLNGNVWAA